MQLCSCRPSVGCGANSAHMRTQPPTMRAPAVPAALQRDQIPGAGAGPGDAGGAAAADDGVWAHAAPGGWGSSRWLGGWGEFCWGPLASPEHSLHGGLSAGVREFRHSCALQTCICPACCTHLQLRCWYAVAALHQAAPQAAGWACAPGAAGLPCVRAHPDAAAIAARQCASWQGVSAAASAVAAGAACFWHAAPRVWV